MSLYAKQKRYFEDAYQKGEHGWPVVKPTPFVTRSVKHLLKENALQKGGRVLDLGCGEGRHTFLCAEEGLRPIGLDYQPLAITRACAMPKAEELRDRYSFVIGDAFILPFDKESLDLIIDYGCFHHVKKGDTKHYLNSVIPLLIPGGFFILSCFSWRFRHYPDERRKRDWIVHQGHYDRFFRKRDFSDIFGGPFDVLKIEEEREGHYAFFHVLMRKKMTTKGFHA